MTTPFPIYYSGLTNQTRDQKKIHIKKINLHGKGVNTMYIEWVRQVTEDK